MRKIIMTAVVLGLAAGAYAAEFDSLAGVKTTELKASVAKETIDIAPVVFEDESGDGLTKSSTWCTAHPMSPGCPKYCTVSPMYPGCPLYCAKNHGDPRCKKSVGFEKSLADDSEALTQDTAWCTAHPMAPGCPKYCTVSPMYPGCPMYCAKPEHHMNPVCKKNDAGAAKVYCPPNALTPGCPQYCEAYPWDPLCVKAETLTKASEDESAAAETKSVDCHAYPGNPGCPAFCRHHHGFPGCK
jgi:hypothetical protein